SLLSALLPVLRRFITSSSPPTSPLLPYTTLFRSETAPSGIDRSAVGHLPINRVFVRTFVAEAAIVALSHLVLRPGGKRQLIHDRSEEHTSELQSHLNLVCRLLLE